MEQAQFVCLSISHKTASLEMRERLHIRHSRRGELLSMLRGHGTIDELIFLDTCHRIELYASCQNADEARKAMSKALVKLTGESGEAVGKACRFFASTDCVNHLFRLICGLDSMVPGEPQIAFQVKQAYERSVQEAQVDAHLHALFQEALSVNKKVRTTTGIDRGNISLASVAVELLKQKLGSLGGVKAAIFGAGKMARLVAERLTMEGATEILVANRTYKKAVEIARKLGGKAKHLDEKEAVLGECEIVVSATAAPHYLITRDEIARVQKQRHYRHLWMVDLAIPRDIEPEVGKLKGVHLFHVDDLTEVAEKHRRQREASIEEAERMVREAVASFEHRTLTRGAAPIIDQYRKQVDKIAQRELERILKKYHNSEIDAETALREVVHRVARKISHRPTVNLKKLMAENGSAVEGIFVRLMDLEM